MEGSQTKPAGKSSASSEKSVPSEKKRILVFPEDRSVGTVWVRERGSSDYRDDMDAAKWEKVSEARSRVEIGGDRDVKLQVEKADRTDLSFLKNLKADDLYALSLGWVPTPNVQLQALEHLTGLGELELMETSITDEGLEHLKPLKALRKLSIGQGNITDSGLEYLAGLTALEVLDARSSRIRGPGLAHLKNLASLRILFLGSNPIDDAGLKDLPKLQSLEHLSLWGCPLSDASMPFLGRLTELKKLDLWGTRVTDAGMVHLEGLRNLTFLRLDNTKVGDAGIGRLKDMRTLEELYLNYTQVTGKGILQLSPLTRLRVLKLDNTAVDDEAMTIVKNLPALEMLEMSSGAKVTDKGLKHLEGHPALNCVVVHNITDQGLASLSRIPSLKRLQIYDSNVTPEGIAALGKLKLEHLAIQGRSVTDALVPAITRLSTVKELSFNNARITDEALQLLQTMTSLQTIYLYDTQISKEGLEEFRKARPNCRINSSDSLPARDVAAKNAAVMKKFQEVYRLEEGEVLRRIAPPFIPERADFYRLEDPSQAQAIPEPPDYFIFRWDGVLGGPGMGFMGSSVTLSNVLHFWNLLERYEYEGPKELLEMSVPGDWIVRKNADRKEVLRTLERILEKDLRRKIRFTEREVEREVTVVRGKYEFHPIPGSKVDWESVHIYVETLDRDEGAGGGSGDLAEFLRWVGSRLNRCVINETDSYSTKMQWRNNMDSIRGGIQDDPAKIAKVFENLARQTSLDFKTERRKVKVWFVTEK
jgi:Leucine-rich repeat (LRR) protein